MGLFFLILILIFVAVEALIGALRGLKFSAIRFAYMLAGLLAATFVAKSSVFTSVMGAATKSGTAVNNPAELVEYLLAESMGKSLAEALGPHLAGFGFSLIMPVFLIVFFLVFRLVSLILYLITKSIIKKTVVAKPQPEPEFGIETPDEPAVNPSVIKLGGAVIGAFAGLLTCAVIFTPLFSVAKSVDKSGLADTLSSTLSSVAGSVADSTDFPNSEDFNLISDLFKSIASSPAVPLMKYTGTEAVAKFFINKATTITRENLGMSSNVIKTKSYNFYTSLDDLIKLVEPAGDLLVCFNKSGGITKEVLSKITAIVDSLTSSEIIADEDKLVILSACKKKLSDTIYQGLGLEVKEESSPSKDYESIEDFKNDVNAIVDMGNILASTTKDPSNESSDAAISFENINVEALLKDEEKLDSFVSSTLSLSNGSEIVSSVINSNVSKYTDGKLTEVITPEKIEEVGKDKIVEVADSLVNLTKYADETVMTDEIEQEINTAIDNITASGLLSAEDAAAIKAEFGIK